MIGIKLKEIRESTGMNKKEFAQYLGLKYTTYNGYETEAREPSSDFLILVSEKFDVSIDYLLGLKEESEILHSYQLRSDEYEHILKYRSLDSIGQKHIQTIMAWEIDRVSELTIQKESFEHPNIVDFQPISLSQKTRTLNYYQRLASAGTGQLVFDDVPVDLIEIPDIPEYKKVKYAIGVNGDSMEPLYYDGDILLVEPRKEIDIGEIGIFIVDGDSFVKKLGRNMLISVNEDYSDIPITEETHCLGLVVDKISSMPEEIPKETKKMPGLSDIDLAALEEGAKLMRKEKIHKREA